MLAFLRGKENLGAFLIEPLIKLEICAAWQNDRPHDYSTTWTGSHFESGLYSFILAAISAVFGPKSFWKILP